MQMRSFRAKDIQDAMQMARETLGDDAVIISTDKEDGGVVVTFALDREEPVFDEPMDDAAFAPANDYFSEPAASRDSLEGLLQHHAIPASIIDKLMRTARAMELEEDGSLDTLNTNLKTLLAKCFTFDPLPLDEDGFRLMFVGPPGSGKTMAVAKVAAKLVVDNKPIHVISTDSSRAAGTDQLMALTKVLGIELEVAENRNELKAMLKDYEAEARVIIDSAGCNPYDFQGLKDLGQFATLSEIEPVLVCAAGTDIGEAQEIASVYSFLDIQRVLISRTDCSRRFGSALAIADAADYAFSHLTCSARAMGDLHPLDAQQLANLLTQYQRERIAA